MKPSQANVTTLPFRGASFALIATAALTLYLGVFPSKAMDVSRQSVADMAGVPTSLSVVAEMETEETGSEE